ncbi:MAG: cytochrome c [Desulfuromonadales bacterium]|nr:cytochrome c [Desulfuromonadales bacterium]
MKRTQILTGWLPLIVGLFIVSTAFAAIEGGDARKGKALAKEKCKRCHIAGAQGGTMTPLSKTQRQWNRFYVKNKHERLAPGAWSKINKQDLQDIMQFMHDHAADSEQPATCGQ